MRSHPSCFSDPVLEQFPNGFGTKADATEMHQLRYFSKVVNHVHYQTSAAHSFLRGKLREEEEEVRRGRRRSLLKNGAAVAHKKRRRGSAKSASAN